MTREQTSFSSSFLPNQTWVNYVIEKKHGTKQVIKTIRTPGEVRGSLDVVWKGTISVQQPKKEPEERIGQRR